jgi:lipoprotein Spr
LKQVIYLLFVLLLVVSCKPTSNIITSKTEAQKKGVYNAPQQRRVASTNSGSNNSTRFTNKQNTISISKKSDSKYNLEDKNADDYVINPDNSPYVIKQLINTASQNLGAGYHTGGTNPNTGFDCSGLMYSTFQKFDITLPRSSNDMSKIGTKLDNDDIKKGDLIFFRTNGKSVINHVGMVTEVSSDEIKFIHSSTQKGVIISSTKEPYYGKNFAQANRIIVQ